MTFEDIYSSKYCLVCPQGKEVRENKILSRKERERVEDQSKGQLLYPHLQMGDSK